MTKIKKTDDQWQQELGPTVYAIARQGGTEAPFSGELNDNKAQGTYACTCCGEPLFDSVSKYDSGCGWPSFDQPISETIIGEYQETDTRQRVEITCSKCDAHLGHVFQDGPTATGLRYCVNSASLKFDKK